MEDKGRSWWPEPEGESPMHYHSKLQAWDDPQYGIEEKTSAG